MKKIDIVVPIYNAYKYTFECINSILKYTDLKKNNVTGVFDSKDTFEDPIPAEIIEIVNASEEENDELTSNIKALLNAKNRGVDLINKNGRGNDTMTRTDLIKNLSK